MAPRGRPTRLNPAATPTPVADPTTTTSVTSAQLQAMIDEGVTAVLAARATTRMANDSHPPGTGDWFERMETVFRISNCTMENQVKFATCTLMGMALTWWNSHARTVTNEVAYAMTWSDLKKKMTTKYCPRNEIKKIEAEMWNLKPGHINAVSYRQHPDKTTFCEGTFLLKQPFSASILFDTGADRSFVSTQFSTLINIAPTTLDHGYNVELADGRIIWVNTVLLGCTLNFLNHPFHVDLMPVEMGNLMMSYLARDWLTKYQAVIDCAKKIVRIPLGSEILIFHGDESRNKRGTRLNIISCTKTQKYLLQGCHVFLAHITIKETGDKSKKERINCKMVFRSTAHLSDWPIEMKELADQYRAFSIFLGQRLYKNPSSSPMGWSSSSIRQEERWIVTDVHRLSGTKQTNVGEEPYCYHNNDDLFDSPSRVECLLEEST
ncbi:putative reverse transcriptase domain-containing protein [Tanacetum coccineum]|uniref:Reverse transcriptase domain-containing protein n=1 Tax=Tanacetum coccineum TaxID=301880 RepID=A0ABQ4WVS4_9ASTR